jgi:uncharacterized protein YkwD
MLFLAVTGGSCALATPESPPSVAVSSDHDHVRSACDAEEASFLEGPDSIERMILALVNRERQRAGVEPLCFSRQLANAAKDHNSRMAKGGFFEHRGRGERGLLERVTFAGVGADAVGENLFAGSQPVSPAVAQLCVSMWMQSDGHRRNMLSSEFNKTGISVSYSARSGSYVTADFAHARLIDQAALKTGVRQMHVSQSSHRRRQAPAKVSSGGLVPVSASSKNVRQHESLHS